MKKKLLPLLFAVCTMGLSLSAQTTGTFIVADNGNRMASCEDSVLTIEKIVAYAGIRDLDDPVETASDYRILELNGSIITANELSSVKYSDYPAVYIEKTGTTFNGHNGIAIFLELLVAPTSLFSKDTLRYTVERGEKVNYVQDFFDQFNFWSSGLETTTLQERILFLDLSTAGPALPITQVPNWSNVGAGLYQLKYSTPLCAPESMLWDSLYVIVTESPCHNVQIKNAPSVCTGANIDLTPYVYVDGHVATAGELADMTFTDKSKIFVVDTVIASPTNFPIHWDETVYFPRVGISYAPNVAMGNCPVYSYLFTTSFPVELPNTNVVITRDNFGKTSNYQIANEYYTTNNVVHKNVLQTLYIDNYDVFDGTSLTFYSGSTFDQPVIGEDLTPGNYLVVATHLTECMDDSSVFPITVKASEFEVIWQSAPALGKGYYTFQAPSYAGATYGWFVWGGSIVNGLNTDQITVYFSEQASKGIAVSCTITFANNRTEAGNTANGGVYLIPTGTDGALEEIPAALPTTTDTPLATDNTSVAYPNPTDGHLMVTGSGELALKVYTTLGQLVLEEPQYKTNTAIHLTTKGMHILHVSQNGKTQVMKVLVK